ncbi:MAG TPA: endonuclease/exonuclease/phosphatase family protein [Opitutaceae bacterium]
MRVFLAFLAGCVLTLPPLAARPFTAVVYNVENLFDVDGVAFYDEYQPARYGPAHLATKLDNIARVLTQFAAGEGPEVILFQEIELDQTPETAVANYVEFLRRYEGRPFDQLLAQAPLPAELAGLPAEAWLAKALADRGLGPYTVVAASDGVGCHEDGRERTIKCVVFTRFPVRAVHNHPTPVARNILEVVLEIDGHALHVFNNHWKSGAGDPETERTRLENARTLRTRLDEILRDDPRADIVIGGDFNSHHDQRQRYAKTMKLTGINDTLRSQGNELALRGPQRDLYNLWYELPAEERGSDTYRGEWGTLMQLIVSRGLYDFRGVQYVDNSFAVARFSGLNVDSAGVPVRWKGDGPTGAGFSDHLPIYARFTTVNEAQPERWLALNRASAPNDNAPAVVNKVSYAAIDLAGTALTLDQLPAGAVLRDGSWSGKLFRVAGEASVERGTTVHFAGESYEVYSPHKAVRDQLAGQARATGRLEFYGELGTYRGRWQFVVKDASWLK